MTQRQNKILGGKKGKKNKDDEISRKPIVFSVEDTEQMEAESARAKMNLTSREPTSSREFSSNFCGQKKITDPFYIATSHQEPKPMPTRNREIPIYPAFIRGLRWSPSIDSDVENYADNTNFVCRTCRMCQKQSYVSEHRDGRRAFKDNIIRFVDNTTMTPRLSEASCGTGTPQSEASYSSVSISSDVATRDQANVQVGYPDSHRMTSPDYESDLNYQYFERKPPAMIQRATEYADDSADFCLSPPYGRKNNVHHYQKAAIPFDSCEPPRKILYNQGISDVVARNFPDGSMIGTRRHAHVKPKVNCSKASVFSKGIPYSHRTQSKYHTACNELDLKFYRCECDDDMKNMGGKPQNYRYCLPKKLNKYEEPIIKMPRKVLSSVRDIESYILGRCQKIY